ILPGGEMTPLVIPNKEIRKIFLDSVSSWFTDSMLAMNRTPLFEAFWRGDAASFQKQLSRILLTSISYHDYHENFYHAILIGMFTASGYAVRSNRESGSGRPDLIIMDQRNARVAIIEVKHAGSVSALPSMPGEALRQIKEKGYAEPFIGLYEEITLWGLAFYEKRCAVGTERLEE
ncbi:MAG: PD-(D/E)XK nuclease domain-containing protein, partial [Mailhella sp.]